MMTLGGEAVRVTVLFRVRVRVLLRVTVRFRLRVNVKVLIIQMA